MRTRYSSCKSLSVLAVFAAFGAALTIGASIASAQTNVGQYEKFELTFNFSDPNGNYNNVYDPAVVDVEGTFTAPSGARQTVPGFYFQDYTRSGSITGEVLTPTGTPQWKVRYAPSELGTYSYAVMITDVTGTLTLGSGTFNSIPSSNPGWVVPVGFHFEFSNGQPFYPLGVNAAWFKYNTTGHEGTWGDGTYGFDALLADYLANGANYVHLWTCSWGVGVTNPFAKPNIACDSSSITTTQMSQPDSWEMDYIIDNAHANGIYIMPILKHRDQQNYDPGDAIYSRYAVARWGYSTNIMAWDTFKEGGTNAPVVDQYATYLHSVDPYKHPVTASQWNHYGVSHTSNFNTVWSLSSLNIVQNHDYSNECIVPWENDTGQYAMNLMLTPPMDLRRFGEPSFFGETGVHFCASDGVSDVFSTRSTYFDVDSQSRMVRGMVWGEFMATSGGYAPWHYSRDPGGAWSNIQAFAGLSAFIKNLPPGPVPDSATLFSSYTDSSQATTSDPTLQVIGRKNTTFSMFRVINTTGTWAAILRDGGTPTPITGSITLFGMGAGTTYNIRWYDPVAGGLIGTNSSTADGSGTVSFNLLQPLSEDVAAIVTP